MDTATKTKLQNKFNIEIHNVQRLSGNYKYSFELVHFLDEYRSSNQIVVYANESITTAINRYFKARNYVRKLINDLNSNYS